MDANEVVEHDEERNRVGVIFELLAEAIRQPRKAPNGTTTNFRYFAAGGGASGLPAAFSLSAPLLHLDTLPITSARRFWPLGPVGI
jgi:hypothetical protein